MRPLLIPALALATLAGCTSIAELPALRDSGPLFPRGGEAESLDFENQPLGRPPSGFVGGEDQWLVADSPTAASGEHVLVRGGGEASALVLEAGQGAKELRAEVAVRVFVGAPGAGVGCSGGEESGYLVRLEPESRRVALYDRTGDELGLVGARPVELDKGKWVRLGIRCGDGEVTGYVEGEAIASQRTTEVPSALKLFADAEVTAQFDDVRFSVN